MGVVEGKLVVVVANGKADVFYRETRSHLRGKWEWLLTEKVRVV